MGIMYKEKYVKKIANEGIKCPMYLILFRKMKELIQLIQ
jgi:hypothetical protein